MVVKENFIETYDDFLPSNLTDNLESVFFNRDGCDPVLNFEYQENLSLNDNTTLKGDVGFSNIFYWEGVCKTETIYLLQPFYHFCFFKNINPLFILRARAFIQAPSGKNIIQKPHTDVDFSHWVFLYYVNDSDGDTIFYNEQKEIIKRVAPKKGRVCFFDGNVYHSSSSPANFTRSVININFIGTLWK